MWKEFPNPKDGGSTFALAKVDYPRADVTGAVVRYGSEALRIRMRFVDLKEGGFQDFGVWLEVPGFQLDYVVSVYATPTDREGSGGVTRDTNSSDAAVRCSGFDHRIDFGQDFVEVSIPRGCLENPTWVRLSIWNSFVPGPKAHATFRDNPHNHGGMRESSRLYCEPPR